ncbi:uncharacterized protein LOC126737734 [Anthonomus grandis grandis]|uniref:uncharacterized protein LOC126737734 n=1 Tax=Anthonomus grandis grandis TaxID=2921223 RepID=UPI0021667B55|nr:uncharacterized protein LOC126737734 [Anthonomus grandis grandis]
MVGEILGILIWCTALYQAIFKRDVWSSLFSQILDLEDIKNLNSIETKERNFLKNVNFQLACTISMIVGMFVYELVTFSGAEKKVFLFSSSYVYFFLHFLLSTIIGNMAIILKNKFQEINNLLSSYEADQSITVIKGSKKVKDLYAAMIQIVERFNELFGPQLFLMGMHCSSQILQWSVALVYSMFASNDEADDFVTIRMVVGVIYIVLMLIWLGVTMFCCDIAVEESEEIITISYRLQLKYPVFSEPYQNIRNLLYLINNSKVKFTAMDYYDINRSTMFDLIGTTATYFVVLIQFYDGNKKTVTEKPEEKIL